MQETEKLELDIFCMERRCTLNRKHQAVRAGKCRQNFPVRLFRIWGIAFSHFRINHLSWSDPGRQRPLEGKVAPILLSKSVPFVLTAKLPGFGYINNLAKFSLVTAGQISVDMRSDQSCAHFVIAMGLSDSHQWTAFPPPTAFHQLRN